MSILIMALAISACSPKDERTHITVQRIFGECRANVPRDQAPLRNPDGECEILTGLIDRFERENPDIDLTVNIVAWPGYDQLSAQYAAGDPPDVVSIHMSSMPDYQSRGLIVPLTAELAQDGVSAKAFTPAARQGITIKNELYGLPFDNWTPLWHINTGLFARAGLMKDGEPILPHTPEELLAQARQFKAATGKPYFVQSMINERAAYTRNLYTYLMNQKAVFFEDPKHIRLNTPEARRIVALFKQIYDENLTTKDQDYSSATQGFMNGQGGVYLVGTWMIGAYEAEANTPGQPLYKSYAVKPYPMLFGAERAAYVDGHAWVVSNRERSLKQDEAVRRFLKFLYDHNYDWSRTGHLPTVQAVAQSSQYLSLPHRRDIVALSEIGRTLPSEVQRQFAIQDIIGDELFSAIAGHKPIEQALTDAETRTNDLLFHLL
ncbi:ABC transporter substrate-binding protein [Asticcacaulis machinosus]|uniref:Extracellular solute-binding protein n=1 Tax=Asticcacaulis machinosus TaxID=2984211 RepID=A0ABT5HP30_9CAUL|nr:extracellular solute-binding protein [Asticcacaulis machinosus]